MNTPRFSVITVCYNAANEIEHTLKSVAQQSYPHIEYIVIDGKSRDNTCEIIAKYSSAIAHSVSEPDNGLYDAMNKGIKAATGDYLIFLNAGDTFYTDNTLQDIVDSLPDDNLPDIIYGETVLVDKRRTEIGMRRLTAPQKLSWKSFRTGMRVCHQAFIAKRSVAGLYNTEYRFSADFDWCILCMKSSKWLHNTHLVLVRYLNEGMTTRNHKASLKERFRIMCRYYGTVPTILRHIWFAVRYNVAKWRGRA